VSALSRTQLPKVVGVVVSFQGLLLTTLSLAAYPLGFSSIPGIGRAKLLGAAVGVALLLLGLLLSRARRLPTFLEYLCTLWQSYWFAPGGNYSLAMARMAVAASILLSRLCQEDYQALVEAHRSDLYFPKGILLLWGPHLPSAFFFQVTAVVAYISTWLFFFGLATRLSGFLSFGSYLILSCFTESFQPGCCHGQNLVHLAQLALLFSPCGDSLSLDALLRRWLRKARTERTPGDMYRWAVLLGQWAAALMFFNAAWHKIKEDGYHFGWAVSDNLRNQLAIQYFDIGHQVLPSLPAWIMADEWHYKGAALGNLIGQTMPLLACIFVRRPLLRAFFGSFFFLEVLGIGSVMGMWAGFAHLLPLVALFIDWDRLLHWLASRFHKPELSNDRDEDAERAGSAEPSVWHKLAVSLFIIWFLEFFILVAFAPPTTQNAPYPFASFGMYCDIKAKKPLNEHKSFELLRGQLGLQPSTILSGEERQSLSFQYAYLVDVPEPDRIKQGLLSVRSNLDPSIKRITLKRVIYQIPPYPADPTPRPIFEGMVASLGEGQDFVWCRVVSKWDEEAQQRYLEVQSTGYRDPHYRFAYIAEDAADLPPKPFEVSQRRDRYYYERKEKGAYRLVVFVSDASLGQQEHVYLSESLYHSNDQVPGSS
jgi:hypothetical protein